MFFNWKIETINICVIIELYVLMAVIVLLTLGDGVCVLSDFLCMSSNFLL